MALSAQVHRNLLGYEKKIGRSVTARTAAFTGAALAAGLAAGAGAWLLLRIPWSVAQFAVLAVTVPVWALGFARPCGMKPERWWPYGRRRVLGLSRLAYEAGERFPAPRRLRKRGGEWDVLQEAWAARERRRGVELWEPSKEL